MGGVWTCLRGHWGNAHSCVFSYSTVHSARVFIVLRVAFLRRNKVSVYRKAVTLQGGCLHYWFPENSCLLPHHGLVIDELCNWIGSILLQQILMERRIKIFLQGPSRCFGSLGLLPYPGRTDSGAVWTAGQSNVCSWVDKPFIAVTILKALGPWLLRDTAVQRVCRTVNACSCIQLNVCRWVGKCVGSSCLHKV